MSVSEQISCHHFVEVDGYAYFSNRSYNGLFQVELKTGKTKFLGAFKHEKLDEFNIHWELLLRENKIYFFPRRGRHVHIYSLESRTISAIEIRKTFENFFRIGEVVINNSLITFLPIEEGAPVKRLDLNTLLVSEITKQDIFQGTYLADSKKPFLKPQLLEKYQIPMDHMFYWEQTTDRKWYAFQLMEHHLLWYNPEAEIIEKIALSVINEAELYEYLQPMREKYLSQGKMVENDLLSLYEYLKTMTEYKHIGSTPRRIFECVVGKSIWSFSKN